MIGADGTTYDLTADQFDLSVSQQLQIRGLAAGNNTATLVATIKN